MRKHAFPLGPLQEQIWRFWRQNPRSTAYIMPEVYLFDGAFDVAAVTFAFDETARRHESLRTTFHEVDGAVVQVVSPDPAHAPVEVLDFRELSGAVQAEQLERAITDAANSTFDLTRLPAIRLTAILLSDRRTGLVLSAHQIICDGSSMALVVDDFGELYRSARAGTTPELVPVTPGYAAFVTEQLATLADDASRDDLVSWTERLTGATGSVLPGDSRKAVGDPAASDTDDLSTTLLSTTLDDRLADEVVAYGRRAGSTPFSVLLAAMNVMIAAATGEGDVCVGTATSCRTPKFARTVGMLTNLVVARSRIDLSGTFAEASYEVSLNLLDAIDDQDLPFSRVSDLWRENGSLADTELVRTTFSAGASGGLALGEGSLSERVARTSQGPFALGVVCDITEAGIALDWQYALRAYSPRLSLGYCDAYQQILTMLLRQPDAAMDSLGITEVLPRVDAVPAERADGRRRGVGGEADA
ncbi:putative polyketide synthase component [Actinoalloteichus sp. GBA129-24]|uniref:Polyketide synthase component n=1 Tax=Actinoalloteichus fjordicus TaxID=1612552 RepID=A0AAC9LB00_9PSEU|nr:putative polyketide synthase component [Actinoalloteichus fjordicus]APU19056.1 putative polyketide synthase component [Actinoalloteichus sp. GBA129-24]